MRSKFRLAGIALVLLAMLMGCDSRHVHAIKAHSQYQHLPASILNRKGLSPDSVNAMREVNMFLVAYRARPVSSLQKFQKVAARQPEVYLTQQAFVEMCVGAGRRLESRDPSQATALYLSAAQAAYPWALRYPAEQIPLMLSLYNYSTSRVVTLQDQLGDAQSLTALGSTFALSHQRTSKGHRVDPDAFDTLLAADDLQIEDVRERVRQVAVGAAFVGHITKDDDRHLPPEGLFQSITAVLTFPRKNEAVLSFYDVMDRDRVTLAGKEILLSTDFTAAWAMQLDSDPNNSPILSLLRPEQSLKNMGLTFTEPYRSDEIPVVLVHGLASNGATWSNTLNELLADRRIRERYQFWLYQYPSGYPFIYPAGEMRGALQEAYHQYRPVAEPGTLDRMVLIGHSMGGLISSSQIRQTDEAAWATFFHRPVDQLNVPEETKSKLRRYLFLKPEGFIRRVVFVCVPHRGSTLADGLVGRMFSKLIKLPNNVLQLNITGILQDMTDAGMSMIDLANNSVTRLQYYNPLLKTLSEMPVDPRVFCHTIAGDRGLNNAPDSSDGVVSYESSHLDFAVSEKMVPAWHSAHKHPEAIAEIRRILLEHLDDAPRSSE